MSDNNNKDEDLKKKLQEQLKKFRNNDHSSPKFEDDSSKTDAPKTEDSSHSREEKHSARKEDNSSKKDSSEKRQNGGFSFKSPFKKPNFPGARPSLGIFAAGAFLIFLVISGIKSFYTINESEEGVVQRFGALSSVTKPGLNWKVPFIDKVTVVNVRRVSESSIVGTILTKDENVVNVELTVQYRIADPAKFLFNIDQPITTIQEAAESSLRYVVGHMNMDEVLTTGRSLVRADTRASLEKILDRYQTGIEIVDVNFQYARPPEAVKEAFDDAIKAQEDEQRYIREAEAYNRSQMPIAKGQAQKIIAEAEGYARSVETQAEGQQAYFNSLLPAYESNSLVFTKRYYLDTMALIYGNNPKVLVADGSSLNFLGLGNLLTSGKAVAGDSSTFSLLDPSKTENAAGVKEKATVTYPSSNPTTYEYKSSSSAPSRFSPSSTPRVGGK